MILIWTAGLLRRRTGRLLITAFGIAVAVALMASLGSFLSSAKATMTQRATSSVAVDWQVAVQPNASGGSVASVLDAVRRSPGTVTAVPVGFADTTGLRATTSGSTQTTGPGKVLGLPDRYQSIFPHEMRLLSGSFQGALVAQQTAANLHVRPGDTVVINRAGQRPFAAHISGVVDLPQADSLFQRVGAPPHSQMSAPPDNVVLLPATAFATAYGGPAAAGSHPSTQIHVKRSHALPADPSAAFVATTGAANNLEARTSGAGVVGNNLGAALDSAREDALYAQVLFLFLGTPGALLAATLTAAVVQAGADRRSQEQALLRARGATRSQLLRLVMVEAGIVGVVGGVVGLLSASIIGRLAFGSSSFGTTTATSLWWAGLAFLLGLVIAALVIVLPARRDLRTQGLTRASGKRPRWLSYGLDILLIAVALGVFWAADRNQFKLVLAPEGIPTISVSYWAFLAPGLAWIGAGLLGWRLADLLLGPGRRLLARLLAPIGGGLAPTMATMLSRQRRHVAASAVLVGLALSFAMSTATFNSTYRQQAEVDAQLTNGADVTVTTSPGSTVTPAYAGKLAQIPGVKAVEPVQHRFAYVGADLQDLYGINAGTISRATTLQDPYFQGGTAQQMLQRLAARPDAVLVSAETAKDYQLNLGDQLRLRLQNKDTQQYTSVTFHYAGVVNEFPTAPKDSFIVANAAYVARQTHSNAVGTFLMSTGGSNIDQVAARTRTAVGSTGAVTTLTDARGQVGSSLTSVDLAGLTKLELSFALVIAVAAGGLLMALGLTERRRSIAVATALGATRRQLVRLNTGEPVFVAAAGIVIGGLTGWGLSYLLVKVLTGVFDPPPTHLALPWGYILAVAISLLAALGIAAAYVESHTRRHARELLRDI